MNNLGLGRWLLPETKTSKSLYIDGVPEIYVNGVSCVRSANGTLCRLTPVDGNKVVRQDTSHTTSGEGGTDLNRKLLEELLEQISDLRSQVKELSKSKVIEVLKPQDYVEDPRLKFTEQIESKAAHTKLSRRLDSVRSIHTSNFKGNLDSRVTPIGSGTSLASNLVSKGTILDQIRQLTFMDDPNSLFMIKDLIAKHERSKRLNETVTPPQVRSFATMGGPGGDDTGRTGAGKSEEEYSFKSKIDEEIERMKKEDAERTKSDESEKLREAAQKSVELKAKTADEEKKKVRIRTRLLFGDPKDYDVNVLGEKLKESTGRLDEYRVFMVSTGISEKEDYITVKFKAKYKNWSHFGFNEIQKFAEMQEQVKFDVQNWGAEWSEANELADFLAAELTKEEAIALKEASMLIKRTASEAQAAQKVLQLEFNKKCLEKEEQFNKSMHKAYNNPYVFISEYPVDKLPIDEVGKLVEHNKYLEEVNAERIANGEEPVVLKDLKLSAKNLVLYEFKRKLLHELKSSTGVLGYLKSVGVDVGTFPLPAGANW